MSERTLEYCPKCGAPGLSRPGVNKVVCPQCKFRLYLNTAAAVCALIQDDRGRLLVTVRANDPKKGFWDLPGGFVDPDESAEQAVIREVQEELGLRVCSSYYLCSQPNAYPSRRHHLPNTRFGLCLPSPTARAGRCRGRCPKCRLLPSHRTRPGEIRV